LFALWGYVVLVTFEDWTQGRQIASLGTNYGTNEIPFQSWRHFKEAFAPELIERAIREQKRKIETCLDPFGGSGTTSLACQFLGVRPTTVEVNPYLADLIEAKLSTYDSDSLARDLGKIAKRSLSLRKQGRHSLSGLPPTFVEPGVNGRWIFDKPIADKIACLSLAIQEIANKSHQRLFRVLLGGVLIENSNVIVNGKGRRYRQGWQNRPKDPGNMDESFFGAAQKAISEIHKFSKRACCEFEVMRGDSRKLLNGSGSFDLCIFSPPYPNSFDYTDIYNVELWTLGYLTSADSNRVLRSSTLCSHVQVAREFSEAPKGSRRLSLTLSKLKKVRHQLWDHRLPEMVSNYFTDMMAVLSSVNGSLAKRGETWLVVGDSSYADTYIATAKILADMAENSGWKVKTVEACRSMRVSAQQGGRPDLDETLIVLVKS
jgi:DNA methylase